MNKQQAYNLFDIHDGKTPFPLINDQAAKFIKSDIMSELISTAGHNTQLGNGLQIYGTIDLPYLNITNTNRDIKKRFKHFDISDLYKKSVLDLGSNIGCLSFEAINKGCTLVHGFEYMEPRVNLANKISKFCGIADKAHFTHANLDHTEIEKQYHVTFALAIDGWVKDKDHLYEQFGKVTLETLYLETHYGAGQGSTGKPNIEFVFNKLKKVGFKTIQYIDKPQVDTSNNQQFRPNYIAYK